MEPREGIDPAENEPPIELMRMAHGQAFYDNSFYNIAVTLTSDDLSRGASSPFVNPLTREPFPLSFSKLALLKGQGLLPREVAEYIPDFPLTVLSEEVEDPRRTNRQLSQLQRAIERENAREERLSTRNAVRIDRLLSRINDANLSGNTARAARLQSRLDRENTRFEAREEANRQSRAQRIARLVDRVGRITADGAHKTTPLRNVELTGPYFHNGGASTLRQVVDLYVRGGNFPHENSEDLAPDIKEIRNLQGNEQGKNDLVAFMLALTDERVRQEKAPFDRPQLFVPVGHDPKDPSITLFEELPAVGAGGRPVAGLPPLGTFLDLSPYQP
jgi:hypothetical protein